MDNSVLDLGVLPANFVTVGIKILAVGLLILGVEMVGGTHFIPDLVTGILIIIGSIGVLAGY